MSKRNIRKPLGFSEQDLEGVIYLSRQETAIAIKKKLTASQMEVWMYLNMVDTPKTINEIAQKLRQRNRTVSRNIKTITEAGIKLPNLVETKSIRSEVEKNA